MELLNRIFCQKMEKMTTVIVLEAHFLMDRIFKLTDKYTRFPQLLFCQLMLTP